LFSFPASIRQEAVDAFVPIVLAIGCARPAQQWRDEPAGDEAADMRPPGVPPDAWTPNEKKPGTSCMKNQIRANAIARTSKNNGMNTMGTITTSRAAGNIRA